MADETNAGGLTPREEAMYGWRAAGIEGHIFTREGVERIVAEREAKAAREVLLEAADEMDDTDDPDAIYVYNGDIDLWLRARADHITTDTP